jgi:ABC-type transport system involved in cytochrome bd biosynthesis fused ATPase/permease subunit
VKAGPDRSPAPIRGLLRVFPAAHLGISMLFVLAAIGLVCFSGYELWQVVAPGGGAITARLGHVLDGIALLTIAVASLELAQTIVEEEVQREAHMSAPTRVRRFLSRFMVVLVVSLSIEALVAVFHFSRDDPTKLPYAAAIGLMAAALLAGWGFFIRMNEAAERLEPEAMEAAKSEDRKIDESRSNS